ncbi:MAG: 30S ribosomal protein S2 [Candidatus Moraniibacteriota bacterium]
MTEPTQTAPEAAAVVVPMTAKEDYFADLAFGELATDLESLLKAGVHFGHLKSRRHPQMEDYIFTTRKNINIIDLEQTKERLEAACAFLADVVKSGKPLLFVGMSKQSLPLVRSLANRLGESYVIDRWLGGTLTNFKQIHGRAKYLNDSLEQRESGAFKKYTKFEQAKKTEEIERLEKKVGGIRTLADLPGAIVIADVKEAGLAVQEAAKLKIPLVGIVDSNTNPDSIDYPIPGNDDAVSSLKILLGALGKAVLEAKTEASTKATTPEVSSAK